MCPESPIPSILLAANAGVCGSRPRTSRQSGDFFHATPGHVTAGSCLTEQRWTPLEVDGNFIHRPEHKQPGHSTWTAQRRAKRREAHLNNFERYALADSKIFPGHRP